MTRTISRWAPPHPSIHAAMNSGDVYVRLVAVARGRCDRAKKPSHIELTPDTLRQKWIFQLPGMMDWRAVRAHASSSTTDGSPRKSTTCDSVAWCSVASFTQEPMMANMRDANNIQRACMEAEVNGRVARKRYYTPLWLDSVPALRRAQYRPRAALPGHVAEPGYGRPVKATSLAKGP